jgi:hypothetical protein
MHLEGEEIARDLLALGTNGSALTIDSKDPQQVGNSRIWTAVGEELIQFDNHLAFIVATTAYYEPQPHRQA